VNARKRDRMSIELPAIVRAIPNDGEDDRTESWFPALVCDDDSDDDGEWQHMTLSDLVALVAALPLEQSDRVWRYVLAANPEFEPGLKLLRETQAENARLREELAHAERSADILRVIASGIAEGDVQLFIARPQDSEAFDQWLADDRNRRGR
jgi:hypothetical protein